MSLFRGSKPPPSPLGTLNPYAKPGSLTEANLLQQMAQLNIPDDWLKTLVGSVTGVSPLAAAASQPPLPRTLAGSKRRGIDDERMFINQYASRLSMTPEQIAEADAALIHPVTRARRIGRFEVEDDIIDLPKNEKIMRAAMAGMVVLRAEHSYAQRRFEYLAMHSEFDSVPKYEEAPHYTGIIIETEGEFPLIRWVRDEAKSSQQPTPENAPAARTTRE